MDNIYGYNFINLIKSVVPEAKEASGASELVMRCPFCGDSENRRSAHLYVSVPESANELSFYDCKRVNCRARGIVDDSFLRKLGCNDANILTGLISHNNAVMKQPRYKSLKTIDIYPLTVNIFPSDFNEVKLKYINKRIGSSFTYDDLKRLKIFLNLYDIVRSNKLMLTRKEFVTDYLNTYFIGFVSYDNCFCGMRNLSKVALPDPVNKRYINYNLVPKSSEQKSYYIIPTSVDILSPNPVQIHIAEGQFDILGIYHNLNNCNTVQNVYIASGGKSYMQALEFVLTEFGIINFEIHLYPDRDVNESIVNSMVQRILLLNSNIYIHRNMYDGEKDFGVPVDRIKDNITKVQAYDY